MIQNKNSKHFLDMETLQYIILWIIVFSVIVGAVYDLIEGFRKAKMKHYE